MDGGSDENDDQRGDDPHVPGVVPAEGVVKRSPTTAERANSDASRQEDCAIFPSLAIVEDEEPVAAMGDHYCNDHRGSNGTCRGGHNETGQKKNAADHLGKGSSSGLKRRAAHTDGSEPARRAAARFGTPPFVGAMKKDADPNRNPENESGNIGICHEVTLTAPPSA